MTVFEGGSAVMLSIVSLMKENFEDIAHFITHHLDIGIDDIIIFYDGDNAEDLRSYLEAKPINGGYSVISIYEIAEIKPHLKPPKTFKTIQNAVHQIACRKARYPWLITLDADEFLSAGNLDATALSAIPKQILSVRLPVAEAVWLPDDDPWSAFGSTGFRTPLRFRNPKKLPSLLRKMLPRMVYREDSVFFTDNVIGHGQGRHIYRRDAKFDYIGPHHAEIQGNNVSTAVTDLRSALRGVEVYHYDAISFERWREKLRRRVENEILSDNMRIDRRRMLDVFLSCYKRPDAEVLTCQKRLFLRMYCLSWRQYVLLRVFRSSFRASPFQSNDRHVDCH
ncbi:glycosyltransferase family 2 protein [Pontibaca salina]|uniref:Glycosyltransferase family 2 protein n=1 Tax=Pontibaca salina TaxID=2795731 RepID=A0A934HTS1_9RHOB|nr:glycosyltransferase family 2 protein [Pontibaca salina]MBI6630375.1 glycosyltransferase family 2 protein [Pontibaca salina]